MRYESDVEAAAVAVVAKVQRGHKLTVRLCRDVINRQGSSVSGEVPPLNSEGCQQISPVGIPPSFRCGWCGAGT
jgi:hypothetical protein